MNIKSREEYGGRDQRGRDQKGRRESVGMKAAKKGALKEKATNWLVLPSTPEPSSAVYPALSLQLAERNFKV